MAEAPNDVIRRRRAVYAALLTIFPPELARQAVGVWDRDYRHGRSPYDGLNVFARQVCGQFGEGGRHRELIQRLMEFFFAPESGLPADPGPHDAPRVASSTPQPAPPMNGSGHPAPSPVPAAEIVASAAVPDLARLRRVAAPAHVATWLRVIQRLVAELQPHDRGAAITLVRVMLQGANTVGVDPVARELVRMAIEGTNNDRLYRVTEAHLQALLNVAYVHTATAIGPVLADRVLSSAITTVEGMPEAALFAPRKLL
jgi:hypothetical protein